MDFATRIFRHLGDVGMVWSLNEIRNIEDKKLLSGHVAMILGDFNLAQNLYLQSGAPVEALNMRRDLLQWDQALHLANKLGTYINTNVKTEKSIHFCVFFYKI